MLTKLRCGTALLALIRLAYLPTTRSALAVTVEPHGSVGRSHAKSSDDPTCPQRAKIGCENTPKRSSRSYRQQSKRCSLKRWESGKPFFDCAIKPMCGRD